MNRFGLSLKQGVRFCSQVKYSGPIEKCFNSVQLLGRVGQDPVTRGENDNFVTFNVATSRSYPKKNERGETEFISKSEWHNITVFRPYLIERVQKQVLKGTRVMITGSIEYIDYTKDDGAKVALTRIVPDDIFVLTGNAEPEST